LQYFQGNLCKIKKEINLDKKAPLTRGLAHEVRLGVLYTYL